MRGNVAAVLLSATLGTVVGSQASAGAMVGHARRAPVEHPPALTLSAHLGRATAPPGPPAPPRAWVLVDNDTGSVIAAGNDHEALPPASTSKLMTALVVAERLPLDGTIMVGEHAADRPAMRIGMVTGERWPVSDALHAMLIVSANDAAYALAEAASGTLEQFVKDSADTATRLGMRDSAWNDPAGLDDGFAFAGGSRASAYDLAVAARNVLSVPALAQIVALPEFRFTGPDGRPHVLRNHDKLLGRYEGAIGLKTGYTRRAGHTLVAAATRNGRTMVAVVLAADDAYGAAKALLEQGFATPVDAPGTGEHLPAAKAQLATTPAIGGHRPVPTFLPTERASGAGLLGRGVVRDLMLALAVVSATAVVLRRRAIRRRRARRVARRRALLEARRAGVLHVMEPLVDVERPRPRRDLPDFSDLGEFSDSDEQFDAEVERLRRRAQ